MELSIDGSGWAMDPNECPVCNLSPEWERCPVCDKTGTEIADARVLHKEPS